MAEDKGLIETMLSSDDSGTKDNTPINLEMFAQDLIKSNLGIDQTKSDPWTEKDYHPSDLEVFKNVLSADIKREGAYKEGETRHLDYNQYDTGGEGAYYPKGTEDPNARGEPGAKTLIRLLKDPELRAKLSSGKFKATWTKETGYTLNDRFNYNDVHGEIEDGKLVDTGIPVQNNIKYLYPKKDGKPVYADGGRKPFLERLKATGKPEFSYGYMRTLGRWMGSAGDKGRAIKINLGGDLTPIDLNKK